jgi:hypothetical protein
MTYRMNQKCNIELKKGLSIQISFVSGLAVDLPTRNLLEPEA